MPVQKKDRTKRTSSVLNLPLDNNGPASPSTAADNGTTNRRKKTVTPEKKKKKLKLQRVQPGKGAKPKMIFDYVITTEKAGPDGNFIVVTMHQKKTNTSGYLHPINLSISNPDDMGGIGTKLVDPERFDCRLCNNLYLRQSHDTNTRIEVGYRPGIYRIGVISMPNKEAMISFSKESAPNSTFIERLFRDECESILLEAQKNNPQQKRESRFVHWNREEHSLTSDPNRSLDQIFVDESVGHIMMAYYFAEDADRNGVYSFLKLNEATGFFSRNKKTGKYSSYAIEEFGYPSGDVSDTEDSDDEF